MTTLRSRCLVAALAAVIASAAFAQDAADFTEMRRLLTEAIEKTINQMRVKTGAPAVDPRVIAALGKVPRHEFAPPELRSYSYLDRPLPVGRDATISQPSLVAVMTDLLGIKQGDRVLEVGIGGGYHTAILAELTPDVYSVEFHHEVAKTAKQTLDRLGYGKIRVNVADGYYGWRPAAPYDAILVRMAIPDVSNALLEQLKAGGRLIAPIGPPEGPQVLVLFRKSADGRTTETGIMPVMFRALPGGIRL
ncbi:MAG: protein-L-isoaspartate(D-aspartate) O-methyltransferase [Betaproteobacteria bacterium]|nr:protein-L-isoaspartate(D-aspartate) O-methyltransferase [Betaproteobacteria bacterium]